MRALCAALVLLVCASARAQAPLVLAPYVQDVRSDGFTVAFETASDVAAEVRAGEVRVATHGRRHEAALRGLPAGARTHYVVTVDGKEVAAGDVVLPDAARPLTFVVYGDTRDGGSNEIAIARAAAGLHPDLALHTGDLVPSGRSEAGWRGFFANEAPLLRDVPVYPALGNHEVYRDADASHFRARFVLPDDGRERLYYRFRFGPAEFIVLDGNAPSPSQTAWLRATLEAADRDKIAHVFVLVHQPPFSLGDHCGSALAQADWLTLFEQHHVRAVFAGHDHAYERMERRGVRYFVSGGGGAPVYDEQACAAFDRAAKRLYRPVHHLLRVRVDGPNVEIAALPMGAGGALAAPLDEVRYAAGEQAFAMDAPPLEPAAPAQRAATPPWTLAGGAIIFLLLGAFVRRKKIR
jgi:calcineurin-like phosphoesterase family protein